MSMFKKLASVLLTGAMILGVTPGSTAFAADPAPAVCAPCVQQALQAVRVATVDPAIVRMIDVAKMEAMAIGAEDAASDRKIIMHIQSTIGAMRTELQATATARKAYDEFMTATTDAMNAIDGRVTALETWHTEAAPLVAQVPKIRSDLDTTMATVAELKEQVTDQRRLRIRVGADIQLGLGANVAYGTDKLITKDTLGSTVYGQIGVGGIATFDIRLDEFKNPLVLDVRMNFETSMSTYKTITGAICLGGYVGKGSNGTINACGIAGHTWGGDIVQGGADGNTLGGQVEFRKFVTKAKSNFTMALAPFIRGDVTMGQSTHYEVSSFYGGHPPPFGTDANNFAYPAVRYNAAQGVVGVTVFILAGHNRKP